MTVRKKSVSAQILGRGINQAKLQNINFLNQVQLSYTNKNGYL